MAHRYGLGVLAALAVTIGVLAIGGMASAESRPQGAAQSLSASKPSDDSSARPTHDASGRPFAATVLAGASTTWSHEEALQGGITWILTNQRPAGNWGDIRDRRPNDIMLGGLNSLNTFENASAGLCLMALLEAERTPEIQKALEKGFAWLSNAPLTLRVTGTVFYSMWAHMYVSQAMCRGLSDPTLTHLHEGMRKRCAWEVERLINLQMLDGGWGYYDFDYTLVSPSGDQTTSFGTASVLLALYEAREAGFHVPKSVTDRGASILAKLGIPNGSWSYSRSWILRPMGDPSRLEGALCRATACNLAMYTSGQGSAEAIRRGLDNLFTHHDYVEIARQRQFPHETWFANAPYYYYYGHYYAALSIKHLDPAIQAEYAGKLAAFIGITKDADGSFWDYPLYGYTKAYGTGYAARILKLCKDAMPAKSASATAQRD